MMMVMVVEVVFNSSPANASNDGTQFHFVRRNKLLFSLPFAREREKESAGRTERESV